MKTLTMLAAASVLALSAGAASAQTWTSINQRQASLDARIDAGVRSGQLTGQEAATLRNDFRNVANLEANYRTNGLSTWERSDLDRRFDLLSARIRVEANDRQDRDPNGGWTTINQRQAALDARIDAGVRSGQLTGQEAATLRNEFRNVANLEANYRANGLSTWERTDLDRRFDTLSARIRVEANDRQDRNPNGGWTHNGVWTNINQRQAQLDQRIDMGVRTGKITRSEAYRLRADFQTIAKLEKRYRANGLSTWERTDLDRRFDTLSARIRVEANDQNRYGYGYRR